MIKIKLSKKEKEFIIALLNNDFILQALDYNYANDNEKEFKSEHHINFKTADKIVDKFLIQLKGQ
jgi:hypothetical protein